MSQHQNSAIEFKITKHIEGGTSSSTAPLGIGSSFPSNPMNVIFLPITLIGETKLMYNLSLPEINNNSTKKMANINREEFLLKANQAYAALDENDRDEMDVWDSTINDGLDDL